MSNEYRNLRDKKNNAKINELLNDMPDFMEDYYVHLAARNRSTETIKSYLYEANVFLLYVASLRKKELKDLEVTDLENVRMTQIDRYTAVSNDGIALTANAMRRKLSVVKSIYKYFIGIRAIKSNPTLLLEGARLPRKEVIKLSDDQVKALIWAIQTQSGVSERSKKYNERMVERDLAIVITLLGTGMRISELVGLNVSDFDTTSKDRATFHIIRKGSDEDVVFCPQAVTNAVNEYLSLSRPSLLCDDSESALFLSTRGTRLTVSSAEKMVKKYVRAAGLPDHISPHKMRATFATKVYKETTDIYAIRDALHHKSIDTSKNYISDKEERKEKAADAASVLFD